MMVDLMGVAAVVVALGTPMSLALGFFNRRDAQRNTQTNHAALAEQTTILKQTATETVANTYTLGANTERLADVGMKVNGQLTAALDEVRQLREDNAQIRAQMDAVLEASAAVRAAAALHQADNELFKMEIRRLRTEIATPTVDGYEP